MSSERTFYERSCVRGASLGLDNPCITEEKSNQGKG